MELALVGLMRYSYVISNCDCVFVCVQLKQD
jgi:hypothetical protein